MCLDLCIVNIKIICLSSLINIYFLVNNCWRTSLACLLR
uniref:Uncharacterized protein n=1 Tax=Anguilla anguilla TaxID=7936 RepID=A0A0E9VTY3_ANGAN